MFMASIANKVLAASMAWMWFCTGTYATVLAQHPGQPVNYEAITVTLPVFLTSVAGTAVATWIVAKYDSKMRTRTNRLEDMLKQIQEKQAQLEQAQNHADG